MYVYERVKTDKDLPIKLHHFYFEKEKHDMRKHWHRSLEIVIPLKGTLKLWIDGKELKLSSGEVFIINSCEVHQLYWIEDTDYYEGYCLQINHDYMLKCSSKLENVYFHQSENEETTRMIINIVDRIIHTYEIYSENSSLYIESHILMLLYVMCESLQDTRLPHFKSEKFQKRIADIVGYLENHYSDDISMEEVARHFDISTSYLNRFFKQQLDTTPKEYLTQYRLAKAEDYLKDTDYAVIDIAYMTGFSNLNSFYSAFKKRYGKSPLQWRKTLLKY